MGNYATDAKSSGEAVVDTGALPDAPPSLACPRCHFVVLAVVASYHYLSPRNRAADGIASTGPERDSLDRLDSAARAVARQKADPMCFASRSRLPCHPR